MSDPSSAVSVRGRTSSRSRNRRVRATQLQIHLAVTGLHGDVLLVQLGLRVPAVRVVHVVHRRGMFVQGDQLGLALGHQLLVLRRIPTHGDCLPFRGWYVAPSCSACAARDCAPRPTRPDSEPGRRRRRRRPPALRWLDLITSSARLASTASELEKNVVACRMASVSASVLPIRSA